MEAIDLKSLKKALNKFGKTVVSRSRRKLKSNSKLAKSLGYNEPKIDTKKGTIELEFYAEDYANFVDLGVQGANPGKLPPKARKRGKQQAPRSPFKFGSGKYKGNRRLRDAIDSWVVRKGIPGTRDEQGRFSKRKSLVFLITRSIYLSGIKPSLFFTTPFTIAFKQLPKDIKKSFALDIEMKLKTPAEK